VVKWKVLPREWTDWIDYLAGDFDFENKREIIRVPNDTMTIVDVNVRSDGKRKKK